jgi:hypothetical protein
VEPILQTVSEVLVPKGRQDSARGFNPGNGQKTTRPHKEHGGTTEEFSELGSLVFHAAKGVS